jgi:hypothetical protein
MMPLSTWLQREVNVRHPAQQATASGAGVFMTTMTDTLRRDYTPGVETLFRLADYFDTDDIEILQIAGYVQRADQMPKAPTLPIDDVALEYQRLGKCRCLMKDTERRKTVPKKAQPLPQPKLVDPARGPGIVIHRVRSKFTTQMRHSAAARGRRILNGDGIPDRNARIIRYFP